LTELGGSEVSVTCHSVKEPCSPLRGRAVSLPQKTIAKSIRLKTLTRRTGRMRTIQTTVSSRTVSKLRKTKPKQVHPHVDQWPLIGQKWNFPVTETMPEYSL